MQGLGALGERVRRPFGRTPVLSRSALRTGPEAGYPRPLGGFGAKGIVTSRRDSDLEAFSHNPADGVPPQSNSPPATVPGAGRARGPTPVPPGGRKRGHPGAWTPEARAPPGARLPASPAGCQAPAEAPRRGGPRPPSPGSARRPPAGGGDGGPDAGRSWGDPREGPGRTSRVAAAVLGGRPARDPPGTPRAPGGGEAGRPPLRPGRGSPPGAPPREDGPGLRPDRRPAAGPAPPWRRGASGAGGRAGGRLGAAAPPAAAGPSHASRPSPTGPALRANPCPEVTDLTCRLPLLALFQHARGCSPWRPAADMGTARRETYTFSPGFSRADESSPDAAGTAALSRARAPISGRTHSRAPCPSQRKENSPRGPRQLLRVRLRRRTGRLAAPVSATPGSGIWTRFPFDRPGTTKRIAPASERRSPIP
ncbi:hypothetical protein Q8A67_013321 [Cirrhinus molitorella]|uniref:Uncharacterized protein n=1 Tax=Cirrhinus molitorella TaxID=172907 RepID=A0AA88PRW3_9TELE|nr:hypothetical protein Q8A67_013295 [Cirrhinus molitorella]KAK2890656.1 hypothetical protein Q8A67_013299 [Cirrhinus molitorella]KAK2890660.1 hypothetical protein Q8A67_013303 [Cirrhinus molitorella]KAK2890668.1 hypothetical protein Q8A67_013311 [Cirrhinus molitorella]KAK2890673.1 hypothetical protein Q8A67_013316 [Cirrhinus molitorella]